MKTDFDILIVGGGLTGPALALALAQAGLRSAVIDALPEPVLADAGFDGRSYALALGSQRLLKALGTWEAMADQSQPILDIEVSDGQVGQGPGPFGLAFDHAETEDGPMGYMVEDRHVRRALLSAMASEPRVTMLNGVTVTAQDTSPGAASITLSDGSTLTGRLLVGADGRRSGTARRAGIGRVEWGYGQTALVCALSHAKPHNGVARQIFLPQGPLAILPLTGNRCSIVWSEEDRLAAEIQAMSPADYLTALAPRFGDVLGDLDLAGDRFTYPLNLTLARRMTDDRLALVGDAAHGVHPIAGQGLNAGFRDVGALAQVLVEALRRGEDIGAPDVLDRYALWRRADTVSLALATDAFNRLFSNDNPLLRASRGIGMGLVNALPALRRGLIREAAGTAGDVPLLLKGVPL
ncbi:UbiH/UbiF/VisC/COQ6 family ubiquinone biosynthesis hydroxylase [Marinibacterium profundimaris]|uniref:2-octaprenyl-6-methoxyphenyl hydroxylase n=1 Tax=Marinibacterium profundimaris TaxID=1679460 RepID=A0A225NK97_9RHOB|nr:UbiH/UbiF/VisC/COQ6 family ubiquinone biosynthesis hydroxylase [Marinibacterium profundimaris]OWU73581.1 2-octaprenyl-6-methoxyphenyl hydroxylase [Marinibacterium profundimaris]